MRLAFLSTLLLAAVLADGSCALAQQQNRPVAPPPRIGDKLTGTEVINLADSRGGDHELSQEEIDAEYNPMLGIPDADAVIQGWFDRSTAAIASLTCNLGVKYGPTCDEYCDVFPAGDGAPIHVFVHGGYWRALDKNDFSFVAPAFTQAGALVAVPNYALCPMVSIEDITWQLVRALQWVWQHAAQHGGRVGLGSRLGAPAGVGVVGGLLRHEVDVDHRAHARRHR